MNKIIFLRPANSEKKWIIKQKTKNKFFPCTYSCIEHYTYQIFVTANDLVLKDANGTLNKAK